MSTGEFADRRPRASEWELGDRTEVGIVLRELCDQLGDIMNNIAAEHEPGADDLAFATAHAGLVAGHNHFEALAALVHEDMTHIHAIVALARAAVETFGRVWRVLEPRTPEERVALARELKDNEIARARKKGIGLITFAGELSEDANATIKINRSLDRYAETAIAVLMAGGADRGLAERQYSLMSGIAHGETLSITSLTTVDEDGPRFELPRGTASTIVRDVLGASRSAFLRHIQLFEPRYESQLVTIMDLAVRRVGAVLAVPRGGAQPQTERTETSAQPSGT